MIDSAKILEDVRANIARLRSCPGPHDFVSITPEATFAQKFRCSKCGGDVDGVKRHWYLTGLAHGQQSEGKP